LLRERQFDVFCLNDSPAVDGQHRGPLVQDFLQRYFPLPSSFELPAGDTPSAPAPRHGQAEAPRERHGQAEVPREPHGWPLNESSRGERGPGGFETQA